MAFRVLPDKPGFCKGCGGEFVRKSSSHVRCEACARSRRLEVHRTANQKYEGRSPPRKRDKPQDRERQKRWQAENREKRIKAVRSYNERNREFINQKSRERAQLPGFAEKRREIDRRYGSAPKRKVDGRMKTAIRIALKGGKAGRSWESLVGYTLEDLVAHIERQFLAGMSWANIGEWHIDHILPKAMFAYETADDPEFRACWALTNLRPLWSGDNVRKHSKRLHLI